MFIGIDGTGPYSSSQYEKEMRDSFVSQLHAGSPEKNKKYFRGPGTFGVKDIFIVDDALTYIRQIVAKTGDTKILMAGYSRGGLIAINVAKMLKNNPETNSLTIECMALFDAVDRDLVLSGDVIPENVYHVYHAIRDDVVMSRSIFGHTGLKGQIVVEKFYATHAGMGNMPWTGDYPTKFEHTVGYRNGILTKTSKAQILGQDNVKFLTAQSTPSTMDAPYWGDFRVRTITEEEDKRGAAMVKNWMWSKIKNHGMVP